MNITDLIERAQPLYADSDPIIKELADALEQMAAALAVKDEALKEVVDSSEECENADGWLCFELSAEAYHIADSALAIQPHAALVAKLKADVVLCPEYKSARQRIDELEAENARLREELDCTKDILEQTRVELANTHNTWLSHMNSQRRRRMRRGICDCVDI